MAGSALRVGVGGPGLLQRPAQCGGEGDAAVARAAPGTTAGMGGGDGGTAAQPRSGAGILEAAPAGGGAGHPTSPHTRAPQRGWSCRAGRVPSARRVGRGTGCCVSSCAGWGGDGEQPGSGCGASEGCGRGGAGGRPGAVRGLQSPRRRGMQQPGQLLQGAEGAAGQGAGGEGAPEAAGGKGWGWGGPRGRRSGRCRAGGRGEEPQSARAAGAGSGAARAAGGRTCRAPRRAGSRR